MAIIDLYSSPKPLRMEKKLICFGHLMIGSIQHIKVSLHFHEIFSHENIIFLKELNLSLVKHNFGSRLEAKWLFYCGPNMMS